MEQIKIMTLSESENYLKDIVESCKEEFGEDDDICTIPAIETYEALIKVKNFIKEWKQYDRELLEILGNPTENDKNIEAISVFETLEHENNVFTDGTQYTIAAICNDENGIDTKFEITIEGNGGTKVALLGLERLKEYILENTR